MKIMTCMKIFILPICLIALISGCASSESENTTGSTTPVTFSMNMPTLNKVQHQAVTANSNDVASIRLSVADASGRVLASTSVSVTPGQAITIDLNVPAGPSRIFTAEASNASGKIFFRGQSAPINLVAGEATAVSIAMKVFNALLGSWFLGTEGTVDSVVVTVLDDSNFMFAEDGIPDGDGQPGMERGTYTWDVSTGVLTATVITDTNGEWGTSHPLGPATVVVSGNTFTYTETNGETSELTKIESTSNPLVGSWFLGVVGTPVSAVITFIDDSNYMIAFEAFDDQPAGIERGTYNWDAETGVFTVLTIGTRTTGHAGLAEESGMTTVSISGNLLTITDTAGPDFLTRVPLQETITLKFDTETVPGVYDTVWDDTPGFTHVFTFNSDGSGNAFWADEPKKEGFTWSVDTQGRLVVDLTSVAPGTLPDRYTLVSGSINAGIISAEVDDNEDGVYELFPTVTFTKQG